MSEAAQNQVLAQPSIPEHYLYKNQLQQYAQRLSLPLPVYETKNEGAPHVPMFRSTVVVDNCTYTSQSVFRNIKSAEQDVAKIALDVVMQKVKDEGSPFICEDAVFCKAALNEYAAKIHLNKPTYQITQPQEGIPYFICSLVFNGVTFTGPVARNKKTAEQLAARAAVLSIMGNPGPDSTMMSFIVKSKYQPYAYLIKKNCSNNTNNVVTPVVNTGEFATGSGQIMNTDVAIENTGMAIENTGVPDKGNEIMNTGVAIENCSGQIMPVPVPNQPFHEFKKQKLEKPIALTNPPIEFVPAVHEPPLDVGTSSAKKRRKKAKKNHQFMAPYPNPMAPTSHLPYAIPQ